MSARRHRKIIFAVAGILVLVLLLVLLSPYAFRPTAQATMIQHTFGNDITLSISGYGSLSKALVSVYLVSSETTVRIFIINVRIQSLNYSESFPYSASVTLPPMNLPQEVWIQTFYDLGDFDFLRTHQTPTVRIVIDGAWSAGSTSFRNVEIVTEVCCIQPF